MVNNMTLPRVSNVINPYMFLTILCSLDTVQGRNPSRKKTSDLWGDHA